MVLRLGLVGHGRWGRNIERTLASFPDVSVAVIAKGDQPPAGLDGALIATQSAHHAEAALPYIAAGIPTFIEKPMATTLCDALRIRDAADRSGAKIFVGHIYLYHPAFAACLALLPRLGAIRCLCCEGMNDRPRHDSSVLWDWLPHDLSMARAILGRDPDAVSAWRFAGDAVTQAAMSKFQFGAISLVSCTSWISPVRRRQMTMVGESATLIFDNNAERMLTVYEGTNAPFHPGYDGEPPLTREMGAFLETIRSGAPDKEHLETGVAVVRAIEAAEKSMAWAGQQVVL